MLPKVVSTARELEGNRCKVSLPEALCKAQQYRSAASGNDNRTVIFLRPKHIVTRSFAMGKLPSGPGDISYWAFLCERPPALHEDRQLEVLKGARKIVPPKLVLAEDDLPLAQMLEYNLLAEGFAVTHVLDGAAAEQLLFQEQYDLAILDWMISKLTGIELCRRLRNQANTRFLPIILLTARSAEEDRVRGLLTGADDYITKPFSVPELIARVKNLLRRSDNVWGQPADADDRTVDVHVGRLRKKLTEDGQTDPIRTIRGAGYIFGSD